MSDMPLKLIESINWLPYITGVLGLLGIVISIRGILVARKDAFKRMDKDFLDQEQRVRDRLEKTRQSQKG